MIGPMRVAKGRRIDPNRRIQITVDGRPLPAHAGDSVASVLLAWDWRVVGRSFKYHRSRGIVGFSMEEPNALVTLRDGDRREPNIRATDAEAVDGLAVATQNRWPSLSLDIMAATQLAGPLLSAGFYYKTFIAGARTWTRRYEPWIRRAAGLGRASALPDPDAYDHGHLTADVVVVGAGIAGLTAALAAVEAGARTVLIEHQAWTGGQAVAEGEPIDGKPAADWVADSQAAFLAAGGRLFTRTTAQGLYEGPVVHAVERVADHLLPPAPGQVRQRAWTIRAARAILATGATQRPLPFAENDKPGIMTADAAAHFLAEYGVAPGRDAVIATTDDDAYRTAFRLTEAGVRVRAILDGRATPGAMADRAAGYGIPVLPGTLPGRAQGIPGLNTVHAVDRDGHPVEAIPTDALLVGNGRQPNLQLAVQMGAGPVWSDAAQAFLPPAEAWATGSVAGIGDEAAIREHAATLGDAAARGTAKPAPPTPPKRPAPCWLPPAGGTVFVDLQNDVTTKDIDLAYREGYRAIEHTKRYTTLGMATDQGKFAAGLAVGYRAARLGVSPAEIGGPRTRPPVTGLTLGALGGREVGRQYRPVRRTGLHEWHAAHGGDLFPVGDWLRPRAYLRNGESLAAATRREAAAVRKTVGLCDVSTLGKIDVLGPDAATFLNRLYMNPLAKLAVGRVRYGVMLREDGIVLDDGTVARLGEERFFVTTTTANAARILAHMEFYAQAVWPELDVSLASATDQWCAIAVAGPESRTLLQRVYPDLVLGDGDLPFMGLIEGQDRGAPIRVFRISFSGERAFEINVPWDRGEDAWTRLMAAGADHLDVTPYGTEALGVLRIEKGHPAGGELDGRTTAADLGLGDLAKKKSDYVGRVLSGRPGLTDPDRPQLVGLRPLSPTGRLRGGAHLVDNPSTANAEASLGWVSSVADSPAVGQYIALGFLKGGLGEGDRRLWATYPLKGENVEVAVVPPCFVDPEGRRLRG